MSSPDNKTTKSVTTPFAKGAVHATVDLTLATDSTLEKSAAQGHVDHVMNTLIRFLDPDAIEQVTADLETMKLPAGETTYLSGITVQLNHNMFTITLAWKLSVRGPAAILAPYSEAILSCVYGCAIRELDRVGFDDARDLFNGMVQQHDGHVYTVISMGYIR